MRPKDYEYSYESPTVQKTMHWMAGIMIGFIIGLFIVAILATSFGCSTVPSGYRSKVDGMTSYERMMRQPVANDPYYGKHGRYYHD